MRVPMFAAAFFLNICLFGQNAAIIDRDDDGFISKYHGGNDCDDLDGDAHPGVIVLAYNNDANLDGIIDESESLSFRDRNSNSLVDVHDLLIVLLGFSAITEEESLLEIAELARYYRYSCIGF